MGSENNNQSKFINIGALENPYYINLYEFYSEYGIPILRTSIIIEVFLFLIYVLGKVKVEPYLLPSDFVFAIMILINLILFIRYSFKNTNIILERFTRGIIENQIAYQIILIFSIMLTKYIKVNLTLHVYTLSLFLASIIFFIKVKVGNEKIVKSVQSKMIIPSKKRYFKIDLIKVLILIIFIFDSAARHLFPEIQTLQIVAISLFFIPAILVLYVAVELLVSTIIIMVKQIYK